MIRAFLITTTFIYFLYPEPKEKYIPKVYDFEGIIEKDFQQNLKEYKETRIIIKEYIKSILTYRYKDDLADDYANAIYFYSKQYDVDLKVLLALIRTESTFNPKAVSKFGAKGSCQVMFSIWGDELISNNIIEKEDDLFDIYKGIEAGCYVLNHYYQKTGCIKLALARYFGICDYSKIYVDIVLNRSRI